MDEYIIFKEKHQDIVEFIELLDSDNLESLINSFNSLNPLENKVKFHHILTIISYFSKYHDDSISFLFEFIKEIENNIKDSFSQEEIYDIFSQSNIELKQLINEIELANIPLNEKNEDELDYDIYFMYINDISDQNVKDIIENDECEEFQSYLSSTNRNINSYIGKIKYQKRHVGKRCSFIEYAALFGAVKIVKLLILHGAQLSKKSLTCAVIGNSFEIVHLIEEGMKEKGIPFDESCLAVAVESFRFEMMTFLFEELNIKFTYEALYESIISYNFRALFYMIDQQPDVLNSRSFEEETIFHDPYFLQNYDIVRILIKFPNVDINIKDYLGI